MKNVNNDKLIVVNFCNIFIGDGGEMFVEEMIVDENLDESKRGFLYIMFGLRDEELNIVSDEEKSWEEIFDYNGNVIEDGEMGFYVEEFEEKKVDFLSKRRDEKLIEWSVEYDMNIGFVKDNKIEEVVVKLKEMMLKDDEENEKLFN